MQHLTEIRWHGRGGQGAKTAAQFLAEAAMDAGAFIQAFPEYGPERAGAPMRAFTRISNKPINLHCGVEAPEVVAVIDPTLLDVPATTEGLTKDAIFIANTTDSPVELKKRLKLQGEVATVDATKIALETIGIPMPNTPMLGALVKVTNLVSLDKLKDKISGKFLKKIGAEKTQANIKAVERAYKEVKIA